MACNSVAPVPSLANISGSALSTTGEDLVLQADEIAAACFVTLDEADMLVDPEAHARITHALAARRQGVTLYLEDGVPPDDGLPSSGRRGRHR